VEAGKGSLRLKSEAGIETGGTLQLFARLLCSKHSAEDLYYTEVNKTEEMESKPCQYANSERNVGGGKRVTACHPADTDTLCIKISPEYYIKGTSSTRAT
jgi:hypothetical protein